ncbi:MAG TPA: hypothetical protein PKA58_35475, partial [Polyangium sp.]|nr:hypothetical protein [Polyangium sp.]
MTDKYFWAKIELLGRRVRYGRCSTVDFLGTQMLRVEVPYPEKQTKPAEPMYAAEALNSMHEVVLSLECKKARVYPPATEMTREAMIEALLKINNADEEQFASVEEYAPGALYGRTILAEEQVREALKPWKPVERPQLPPPADEDDWDPFEAPHGAAGTTVRVFQRGTVVLQNGKTATVCDGVVTEIDEPCKKEPEVHTVNGDEDAVAIVDSQATSTTTVRATNSVEVVIEGYECTVLTNLVRPTHEEGVAGFYSIVVEGKVFRVWGVWDNEYERGVQPHLFEFVQCDDSEWTTNDPECSIILIDGDEQRETLFAEHVARELSRLPRVGENADTSLVEKRQKDRDHNHWCHKVDDVHGDTINIQSTEAEGAIAELVTRIHGGSHAMWCPNTKQLEALHARIGEILTGRKSIETAIERSKEPEHFIDINEHSYVAAHIDLEDCPRCKGAKLHPQISLDGSAYEADHCTVCGGTWWAAYPVPAKPEMVRSRQPDRHGEILKGSETAIEPAKSYKYIRAWLEQ